jgi:hypothetical protein
MNNPFLSPSTRRFDRRTLGLILTGMILLAFAATLGIEDNWPGIVAAYLGLLGIFLPFALRWKKLKSFIRLFVGSLAAFVVLAVLHNLFEVAGQHFSDLECWATLFNGLGGLFFLLATLVCPVMMLIGFFGTVFLSMRARN